MAFPQNRSLEGFGREQLAYGQQAANQSYDAMSSVGSRFIQSFIAMQRHQQESAVNASRLATEGLRRQEIWNQMQMYQAELGLRSSRAAVQMQELQFAKEKFAWEQKQGEAAQSARNAAAYRNQWWPVVGENGEVSGYEGVGRDGKPINLSRDQYLKMVRDTAEAQRVQDPYKEETASRLRGAEDRRRLEQDLSILNRRVKDFEDQQSDMLADEPTQAQKDQYEKDKAARDALERKILGDRAPASPKQGGGGDELQKALLDNLNFMRQQLKSIDDELGKTK